MHGAFLDAAVESATVAAVRSPLSGARAAVAGDDAALRLGTHLEGCLRALSNVLERLHHSSAFYILLSPGRFLGAAAYMPPGGLLLGALLLSAGAGAARGAGAHWPDAPGAREWAHAGAVAAAVHGAGAAAQALLLRAALPARAAAPAAPLLAAWACVTAALCCAGLRAAAWLLRDARPLRDGPWLPLKALALAAIVLALSQALILSPALGLPCAALLVPACLAARPAPPGGAQGAHARSARAARWLLLLAASPPVVLALAAAAMDCAPGEVLWRVAEQSAAWDTLAAPLALRAYLPCFVLLCAILAA